MHWNYTWGEKHYRDSLGHYQDDIVGAELYTDSYYYYSEGDSLYNHSKDGIAADTPYAKTYYKSNETMVYLYIRHVDMFGPSLDNMLISNGEEEIRVRGYIGHGLKKGPLFKLDGEYIYTTHADTRGEKYGPCKISIETGEITYLDDWRTIHCSAYYSSFKELNNIED